MGGRETGPAQLTVSAENPGLKRCRQDIYARCDEVHIRTEVTEWGEYFIDIIHGRDGEHFVISSRYNVCRILCFVARCNDDGHTEVRQTTNGLMQGVIVRPPAVSIVLSLASQTHIDHFNRFASRIHMALSDPVQSRNDNRIRAKAKPAQYLDRP